MKHEPPHPPPPSPAVVFYDSGRCEHKDDTQRRLSRLHIEDRKKGGGCEISDVGTIHRVHVIIRDPCLSPPLSVGERGEEREGEGGVSRGKEGGPCGNPGNDNHGPDHGTETKVGSLAWFRIA